MVGDRAFVRAGAGETGAEPSRFGKGASDAEVFIPFNTAYTPDQGFEVIAASKSPDVSEEAQAEITFYMRHRRHLRVDQPDNFRIEVVQKFVDQFKSVA